MDRIALLGLELSGGIGVYEREKGRAQRLVLDVVVGVESLEDAARADALDRTIDYDAIARIAKEVVEQAHHHLIETVAHRIAERVSAMSAAIESVTVGLEKPGAVPSARTVRVEVERTRRRGKPL